LPLVTRTRAGGRGGAPAARGRNRALITLLHRSGLCLGEALALYPKDVDVAGGTITVLHGKGDRLRTVGIDPGALALLQRWLDAR
jgi:site-specific recombinase XerC